jgi:NADH-quinone oxidoreductase subunit F
LLQSPVDNCGNYISISISFLLALEQSIESMSKNLSELSGRKGLETNLFEELGLAAQKSGTPSKADLERIAAEFLVGKSTTYGTATFYDFMKPSSKFPWI